MTPIEPAQSRALTQPLTIPPYAFLLSPNGHGGGSPRENWSSRLFWSLLAARRFPDASEIWPQEARSAKAIERDHSDLRTDRPRSVDAEGELATETPATFGIRREALTVRCREHCPWSPRVVARRREHPFDWSAIVEPGRAYVS